MSTTTVIVESRDLDTDARERTSHQVPAPVNIDQERYCLVELVRGTHPGAKPRTFANGAATFLGRQHLIVAFYEERVARRRRPAPQEEERLFDP